MSFELVRLGWANTVAIAALAIMPMVSLAALPEGEAAAASLADAATICPAQDGIVLAALLPSTLKE
jgi:hypothetical protein